MPTPTVTARALKEMLHDGEELALLDVREEGVYARGHLLLAVSVPVSRLELWIDDLVPRRGTRIVLVDDDDGLAGRAARRLADFGYTDVRLLAGGTPAWKAEGFVLFGGINVPSKAFGEFVEVGCGTPSISPEALKAKMDAGEDLVVLDSRPMDEYRVMNIPGSLNVPGAELVYRVHDIVRGPGTLVVVNCAGRTRSIIGAQSLIDAGIPNRVVALRNGTMGWHLAGFALERGAERRPADVSPRGRERAWQAARKVGERYGVRYVDRATLRRWRAEAADRTLYVLDVRLPEEYEVGHLAGTRPAPGGQLVQTTDRYIGTRHARVVLVDDTLVRATMTASWLLRMGLDDVFVLREGLEGEPLERGPHRPRVLGLDAVDAEEVTAEALAALRDREGAVVVDLAYSKTYRNGHIPGAWFAIRSRLAESARKLPVAPLYVLTSEDGVLARLSAPEFAGLTGRPTKVLRGGTAAWRRASMPLADGFEHMADEPEDQFYRPYDRTAGAEAAMQEYLSWELGLVHQVEQDGDLRFRRP